jgi:hypothetical protein
VATQPIGAIAGKASINLVVATVTVSDSGAAPSGFTAKIAWASSSLGELASRCAEDDRGPYDPSRHFFGRSWFRRFSFLDSLLLGFLVLSVSCLRRA